MSQNFGRTFRIFYLIGERVRMRFFKIKVLQLFTPSFSLHSCKPTEPAFASLFNLKNKHNIHKMT